MSYSGMSDAIGGTPLVRLRMEVPAGTEVYVKLELANPFGMKDRVARSLIEEARASGALLPGAPIVESSSGTLALGVALVGISLGHPVHIVTDPRIDAITLAKLRALGAEVHVVAAMTSGGWQSARLERLATLMADLPGAFWPRQYSNPDNPRAYRALAAELVEDLGTVDVLVGSVGSGGSLCGSSRALRRLLPRLRAVGVDCVGSALFGQPDRPGRLQSGLGNSLSPHNLDRNVIDEVHWLNDREAFEATRDLAREQQIFAGNTSGSVYRVLGDVARRAAPGSRIVGILPDRGDRYAETVYSDEYWASHDLFGMPAATVPERVSYGTPVHTWSRADVPPHDQRRIVMFVESNTTGTGMTALRTARDLGLTAILLTGDPGRYPGLDDTGAEVLRCDTNSIVALRDLIQQRFARQDLAGVMTTSDFYAVAAATLSDWLDLPGNQAESVTTCRDKRLTRRVLESAGVTQPRHAAVTDPADVSAAIAVVGLPCVVKPVDDSGSHLVRLCVDATDARAAVERILAVRTNVRGQRTARSALLEEFVDGAEFSVETFTVDGLTTVVGITAKSVTSGPCFVETGHVFPAELPPADASAIEEAALAALKAVGWRLGAAHTEVKLGADGAYVIEVNPRLAGGMIPEAVRLATGVDLLEQQIRVATGMPWEVGPARRAYAGIRFLLAPEAGLLRAVDGTEQARATPGITSVHVSLGAGAAVRPAEDAYDRAGHLIATGGSVAEVGAALDSAVGRIRLRIAPNGGTCRD